MDAILQAGRLIESCRDFGARELGNTVANREIADDIEFSRSWIVAIPDKTPKWVGAQLEILLCACENIKPRFRGLFVSLFELYDVGYWLDGSSLVAAAAAREQYSGSK